MRKSWSVLKKPVSPAGVVNMVTGRAESVIGQGIADHEDINGNLPLQAQNATESEKGLDKAALARGAKYQLEMGRKNPVIVAADADLNLAVEAVITGAFRSTGQKCTATSLSSLQLKYKKSSSSYW